MTSSRSAKSPRTPRGSSAARAEPVDDVTAYALAVQAGEIIAGPHVRAAADRHLDDLEKGTDRSLYFDAGAAQDFFDFCAECCTVTVNGRSVPFILSPAQRFKYGSIFGWKVAEGNALDFEPGTRRFRTAFIEEGKGNGKSPGAAAVGLYFMLADGEANAEVYAAGSKKDQAMVLFRDAVSMVTNSPELSSRVVKSGVRPVWQLSFVPSNSFFKPIANDEGQSGPRPSCGLIDEIHEHKDRYTVDMIEAGFKSRAQPLLFIITNSGTDRQTVAYEYHEHACHVAAREVEDDSFFAYVCALDDGDDPFTDESCWAKANPEIDVILKRSYVRKRVADALHQPSKQNDVMRLNFCIWTEADRAWMTKAAWERTERRPPHRKRDLVIEDFVGAEAYGGLDLSFSQDLTARAIDFPETIAGALHHHLFLTFWTPEETLLERERRDRVPYSLWVKQGLLTPTQGKIVQMGEVGRQLHEDQERFDLRFVAFDRYRHKDLKDRMADGGFDPPMIEHPQGFRRAARLDEATAIRFGLFDEKGSPAENPLWMPSSIEEFEHSIIEERLWTPVNAVLRWNIAGVTPRDDPAGTGNKVFDKRKATGRIDGAVAAAMAIGAAAARFTDGGSALLDFLANPVMTR